MATETDQPAKEPNPPAAEQAKEESSDPAPAETASTLDLNAESFLHDFSPDEVLESEEDSDAQLARDAIDLEASLNDAEASPVVTLVDRILLQAMSVGASDIHVEPQQKGLRLRFRQDGVLQQYVEPLPSRLVPAVTSRFKILADLDIAERRQAQEGRIRRKYRDRVIDFRVNTLPSRFGEKVCLRLLDSGATQLGLDKLIDDPDALALVRELGSKPFGMILVTGPTGSGKSTTLYSLLAERNDPGINISTVEDPIEYTLPGITQCQVNRDKGRVGIYEVLRIQEDMVTAISKGASTDVIRQLALESGMVTLLGYSLDLMATQQKLPMFKRALTKVSLGLPHRRAGDRHPGVSWDDHLSDPDVRGDLRRSGRRAAGLHQAARRSERPAAFLGLALCSRSDPTGDVPADVHRV